MFEQTELDEIVQEFLVESHENLDQLDRDLVALERNPGSPELLGAIFRTIHTIKGTSGFLAFSQLETVSHVGENLLSRLRDGELEMTFERAAALLELVDAIRVILAAIEATGTEGQHDHADLLARLGRLQHEGSGPAASPAGPGHGEPSAPAGRPATSGRYDAPEAPDGSFDSRNALSDNMIRVDVC